MNANGKEVLINRTQMLKIAQEYNIFVSQGTIHRWANEPDFPRVVGKDGKHLLYSLSEFSTYLNKRIFRMRITH